MRENYHLCIWMGFPLSVLSSGCLIELNKSHFFAWAAETFMSYQFPTVQDADVTPPHAANLWYFYQIMRQNCSNSRCHESVSFEVLERICAIKLPPGMVCCYLPVEYLALA